jgi:hypothetical protein
MPSVYLQPATTPAMATSLSGRLVPSQTNSPSQGPIFLYSDINCKTYLSESVTPLAIGKCIGMPFQGIHGVLILVLLTCPDQGTTYLLLYSEPNCQNNTGASGGADMLGYFDFWIRFCCEFDCACRVYLLWRWGWGY